MAGHMFDRVVSPPMHVIPTGVPPTDHDGYSWVFRNVPFHLLPSIRARDAAMWEDFSNITFRIPV